MLGYAYERTNVERAAANSFAVFKFVDLGGSGDRAMQAYRHDAIPVAIYSFSEYLDKLKAIEQAGKHLLLAGRCSRLI